MSTRSASGALRIPGGPKKGYIGPVSTKAHSGDPDGTYGFGSFLGFWRLLALKFGFYKKFHRQNRLETSRRLQESTKMYIFPISKGS